MEKEIRCPDPECNTLFGKEEKGQLKIKNRDLHRTFEGGKCFGPCRRCGRIVYWPEESI